MARSGTKRILLALLGLAVSPYATHANMAGDLATSALSAIACGELPACQLNAAKITGQLKPDVDENTKTVKKLPDSAATAAQIVQQTQANNAPNTNATAQQVSAQASKVAGDAKNAASQASKLVGQATQAAAQALAGGALDAAYCMSTYPPSLDSSVPSNSGSRTKCVTQSGLMATALAGLAKQLGGQAENNKNKAEGLEREASGLGQASGTVGSYGGGMATGGGTSSLASLDPPSSSTGSGLDLSGEYEVKDPLGEQPTTISNNLNGAKTPSVNLGSATPFSDEVANDPRASQARDLLSGETKAKPSPAPASTASAGAGGSVAYTGGASEAEAMRKKMEGAPGLLDGASFNGGLGMGALPGMSATEADVTANLNAPMDFGGFSAANDLELETTDTHYTLSLFDRATILMQYMDVRTHIPLAQGAGRGRALKQLLASKGAKPRDSLEEAKAAVRLPASPLDSRK